MRWALPVLACAGWIPLIAQAPAHVWGASQVDVNKAEAQPLVESEVDGETVAQRAASWGETPARLLYVFASGRLVRSKYIFTAQHEDPADFLNDYSAIAARMVKEYGRPTRERAVWENDSLQEERIAYLQQDRALPSDILPSDKGSGPGLAAGHVKLYAQWCGPQTEILHTLTGADGKVTHQIEFRSIELKALESRPAGCPPPVL